MRKIKVRLDELSGIAAALNSVTGVNFPTKVAYAIAKNRAAVLSKGKDAEIGRPVPPLDVIVRPYDEDRFALCREYAVKDKNGNPMLDERKHFIIDPARHEEFEAKVKQLQTTKYPQIGDYEEAVTRYRSRLKETEVEVELHTVPLAALTIEEIKPSAMAVLVDYVLEE